MIFMHFSSQLRSLSNDRSSLITANKQFRGQNKRRAILLIARFVLEFNNVLFFYYRAFQSLIIDGSAIASLIVILSNDFQSYQIQTICSS